MCNDTSEYVASFLNGFAYRWLDILNEGDEPFR
jgi:hypothetical protein